MGKRMRGLVVMVVMALVIPFLPISVQPVQAIGERIDIFTQRNGDNSILVEGLAEASTVNIELRDEDEKTFYSATVQVNNEGYYQLITPSFKEEVFKESRFSKYNYGVGVYVSVPGGAQAATSLQDFRDRYESPSPYEKYREGYQEQKPVKFEQYGVGSQAPIAKEPTQLKAVASPVSVAASETHTLALGKDGKLYGWGKNTSREINESEMPVLPPTLITTDKTIKKIEAGEKFSLYITTDGELYGWGDLNYLGVKTIIGKPTKITLISEPITDMNAFNRGVALLTKSGNVYQLGGVGWANDEAREFVHNHYRQILIKDAVSVSMSNMKGYALKKDGTLWTWNNSIVEGQTTQAEQIAGFKDIQKFDAANTNDEYIIAVDSKGELWGYGDNSARQLGQKVPSKLDKPTNITNMALRYNKQTGWSAAGKKLKYTEVSLNVNGVLLLTENHEMLTYNTYPRLGDLNKSVSYIENTSRNIYWISGGKLWVWGYGNEYGQQGIGVKTK
ncbi:alpha-tubulin suppressor-like RCC1 family protein [Fontibacillus phaseoli]|uniref:Alpha-tubulin suppressor-like RCC1 family protein n=1 Tax=Fontibacillus phaseoli TaxID=1416533 RepID=A0A369B2L4_9BACL|nr:hypothetical protein [Fontibacillus phaseoli]RCX15585.1 alpha-tubulin suppressor-like RCC1 family protein [Fontibacillus phaseoli]